MAFVQIPQIDYPLIPGPAFPGMLADSGDHDIATGIAEVALDVGLGVVVGSVTSPGFGTGTAGASGPSVKLPASSGDVANLLWGVTQYLAAREPQPDIAPNRYRIGDAIPCVKVGRIWVQVDATSGASLVDQGPVFLVYSGANAGKFRGDTGGGTAAQITNAKVLTGGLAGGVARIRVNLL
jgi:hypothetical protein